MKNKMRLIDADKIDFSEIFGGQSEFARDIRETAQEYINKQPTVSGTEERWISVEERLPEEGQEVWISTKTDCVRQGMYTKRYGYEMREGFICADGFMYMNTASVWQPYIVPESYHPQRKEGAECAGGGNAEAFGGCVGAGKGIEICLN